MNCSSQEWKCCCCGSLITSEQHAIVRFENRIETHRMWERLTIEKACDSGKKGNMQCSWWFAACGGQLNRSDPNAVLVVQDRAGPSDAKSMPEPRTTVQSGSAVPHDHSKERKRAHEIAKSTDELMTSRSIVGHDFADLVV